MNGVSSRLRFSTATLLLCGLLTVVLPPVPHVHATASWLAGWNYRQAITVDNAGMAETLTNFPLYVPLSSTGNGSGIASKILDTGYDIRFTSSDGTTTLPYEREAYSEASGNASGRFWVGVTLNADNDAETDDTIYLYYGNAAASDGQDTANGTSDVWDGNFEGVWHLGETGTGASGDYKDSTSNANNSTSTANQPSALASAVVGGGQTFNGTSSYVQLGISNFPATNAAQTISFWAKYSSTPADSQNVLASIGASNAVQVGFRSGSPAAWKYGGTILVSGSAQTTNTWHQYTFVTNGSSHTLYIDGANAGTGDAALLSGSPTAAYLGTWNGSEELFAGSMDEARISSTARSASWAAFEYANMSTAGNKLSSATEEGVVSTWLYRKTITIQNDNVTSDLTNFPLLVRINADTDIGGASQSDGDDIRFTDADGRTLLPFEREDYRVQSGSGSGSFWVNVPTIKASGTGNGSGATIYLYYGKADAADGQDPTNVWDASFEGVWHMGDAASPALDSTANNNDVAQSGGVTFGTAGKVDGATSYEGTDDRLSIADNDAFDVDYLTISAWAKADVNNKWQYIASKNSGTQQWDLGRDSDGKYYIAAWNSAGTLVTDAHSAATASTGTWEFVNYIYNGTTAKCYVNAAEVISDDVTGVLRKGASSFTIGSQGTNNYWDGSIDELRVSSVARSAAWVKFEYYNMGETDNELSWDDTAAPTVSALSPTDDATGVSTTANLVITFDEAVDPEAGAANDITIKETSDDSTVETIDAQDARVTGGGTTTITINPAATLNEGTEYYVLIGADAFDDAAGNSYAGISSTTAWSFATADTTGPVISGTAATAGSAGADITWSTNEFASSQVQYGTTEALGSTTAETDTGTRVQAHSVTLSGLPGCTRYFYRPISRDASANASTGSTLNFTTTGCTNSASVSSQTGSSIPTGGGSLGMTNGGSGAALTVPAAAATNAFTLQIKKIDKDTVIAGTSTPSGTSTIGDHTYDIRAISGSTVVTSFLQPITVTMEYTDAQVDGYAESTLWIYRWDGSAWNALSGCTVDTAANTVTCTTTHFSTFGLFGSSEDAGDGTSDSASTSAVQSNGGGGHGSRGRNGTSRPVVSLENRRVIVDHLGNSPVPVHAAAAENMLKSETGVQEEAADPFRIRVCSRVRALCSGNGKMLERVNGRLERRFGFRCEE